MSGRCRICDAGQRVAGEINCNLDPDFEHPDEVFIRNHAPKRTVLGIIGKDGCMSEYINLPVENLHRVRSMAHAETFTTLPHAIRMPYAC